MVSWAALNRIAERQRAYPKYRKQLLGRAFRLDAKVLTDEELLAKLRSFGLDLSRDTLEKLCETALSAEEITKPLLEKLVFKNKQEELESDWIWICLTELWIRWFPDKPCFELLDDKMQDGYDLLDSGNAEAACNLWLDAWSYALSIFDKTGMRSIKEFDERFRGTQFLSNWLQDLERELWNLGLSHRPFLMSRISLCEELFRKFPSDATGIEHDITTGNWRRSLAESYFEIGETAKAEALFREWLEDDPQWGWGWIGWADRYYFGQPSDRDLQRAEQLLRQGLSIADVRDRLDLMDRLAGVLSGQGQSDQAREIRQQIKDSEQALRAKSDFLAGRNFGRTTAMNELPIFANPSARVAPGPAIAQIQKVGRNEPCPCLSGKKFKRCCE